MARRPECECFIPAHELTPSDYDKLADRFGAQKINADLLARFERVTGRKPHPLMRRGTFYTTASLTRSSTATRLASHSTSTLAVDHRVTRCTWAT
jgi:hypothetical protein